MSKVPAAAGEELRTLLPLIAAIAPRGERPAVIALAARGAEVCTSARLAGMAAAFAADLRARGAAGATVAVLAANRAEWVAACLGAIAARAIPVPLDVQLREDLLRHALRDCGARWIYTTRDQADRLGKLDTGNRIEPILLDAPGREDRAGTADLPAAPEPAPGETAALFYTSGTTGPPKGVPLTHANLVFQLDVLRSVRLLRSDDRVLLPLPFHHIYPFVMGMLAPLREGIPIILPRSLTGPQVVRAIREADATILIGVPRLFRALHDGIEGRARSAGRIAAAVFHGGAAAGTWLCRRAHVHAGKLLLRPLHRRMGPKLRLLASGGAPLDEELAWRLQGLGWRLATGYGLSETSPLLALDLPGSARPGTVGRPVPGVGIRIDAAAAREAEDEAAPEAGGNPAAAEPAGAAAREDAAPPEGEIQARGPGVFGGYRNLPEETKKAFTGDGWFRTGDLGRLDEDGYLHVSGRVSTMIVTEGGKHVQPDDLEELYGHHAAIKELAVLQKDRKLVALVVAAAAPDGAGAGGDPAAAVRQALQERAATLPSYQHLVDFAVTAEALPRTRLGKVRRGEIEERYDRAKAGKEAGAGEAAGPVAPESWSAEDRALLESPAARATWEWLGQRFPGRRISPDTQMQLELGVDSLEWLSLTLEIGARAGAELCEEAVGRIATVRDLLREMGEAEAGGGGAPSEARAAPLEHPEEALSDEQKRWLEPQPPWLAAFARLGYGFVRALIRRVWRLQVRGRENLPEGGPYILAPNHTSYLDALAVAAALDPPALRRVHWAGASGIMFRNPLFRFISRLAQVTPVDPRAGLRSSLAFAAAVLERGRSLVWFPEGGISPSGRLQDFKPGIGMILEARPVPVLPVFVHGTRDALPPGTWRPHRARFSIAIGAPLDPASLLREGRGDNPRERIATALHDRVAALEPVARDLAKPSAPPS